MLPRLRNQRGFSLVEAILSMVVLGTALVPLVNLFSLGVERNPVTPHVVAALLAAEKMEEVIASRARQGWMAFTASPTTYQVVDSTNFPAYQWKVEVVKIARTDFNQDLGLGANTRYNRITVFVKRPGDANDSQALKLTTIVTDY